MSLPLATVSTVRSRGALSAPPSAGSVTDPQVTAALTLAGHKMSEVCGYALYLVVSNLADDDSDVDPVTGRTGGEKKKDFTDAECYFALARIEPIAQIGKVTETGTPMSMQIGREVKTFAPLEEASNTAASWEAEAYRALAPYLSDVLLPPPDTAGNYSIVSSANRKIRIGVV